MALTVTLLQLTTWAKQRAHMENGGPVAASEWTDLINAGIRKLYRTLTQSYGPDYFTKPPAYFTTQPNVDTSAIPSDFFKLVSVWVDNGSGVLLRIRRANEDELEQVSSGTGWGPALAVNRSECPIKYSLRAGYLRWTPMPTAQHLVKLNYIAAPVTLVNPGDPFDGYGGFEEYVVWDVVAAALAKEESDASFAMHERDQIANDIKMGADRDQSEPGCILDTVSWQGE